MSLTHEELATALGVSRVRVTQLVGQGMPVESVEGAIAWRDRRRSENERAGHIAVPVRPLSLDGLDSLLERVSEATGDDDMDMRISKQVELVETTRTVFEQSVAQGDPSQTKLYGNYDKALATLLRLERERNVRLQERGRLVDANEASQRFSKILSQLVGLIDKAELTVAPSANPENPPKALKAFREFKQDLFRKISEYNPKVELTESVNIKELPPIEEPSEDGDVNFPLDNEEDSGIMDEQTNNNDEQQ